MKKANDFETGEVWKSIVAQSVPLIVAQFVHLLYNVVDRVYIGHLPGVGSLALTGIGLTFPLTTLTAAFTSLYGTGGAPLFAIARGAREEERAEKLLGQVTAMLLATAAAVFVFCYALRKPILYLFGASDASYAYADEYLRIYLYGTVFSMLATGLNGFINAQGFPQVGMGTTVLGAALNLILDPIFIFGLHMGVRGAALATVLSQAASAAWVLLFFRSSRTMYRIRRENMRPDWPMIREIVSLGLAGFIVQATNCAVQVVCNMTLRTWGGDLYVGVMTVLNSVREILTLPVNGITSGAQPVLGYNYGARRYSRVKKGIRFMMLFGTAYTVAAWLMVVSVPQLLISIFTNDAAMIEAGTGAIKLYFYGFFFMVFQFSGQASFTSLRCPKRAIFFSLLRKAVIVVPLTILLPGWGFGLNGVFLAEPISNALGGLACFTTMYLTLYRRLPKTDGAPQ